MVTGSGWKFKQKLVTHSETTLQESCLLSLLERITQSIKGVSPIGLHLCGRFSIRELAVLCDDLAQALWSAATCRGYDSLGIHHSVRRQAAAGQSGDRSPHCKELTLLLDQNFLKFVEH
jgi:hypothetical protein